MERKHILLAIFLITFHQRIRVIVAEAVIVSNILVCGRYVCILAYTIVLHIGVVSLI